MPTLGITGGIATGKSAVTALLQAEGAVVFSADEAAREVVAPGSPVLGQIAAAFGPDILLPDGRLDRARLGARVFADPPARRILESLTHPAILALLRARMDAAVAAAPPGTLVVIEAPLLYEAGMEGWFDAVVVVACSEATQIARLRQRDGLDAAEARRRLAAQMPLEEKIARADYVLWNEGRPEELAEKVRALREALGGGR